MNNIYGKEYNVDKEIIENEYQLNINDIISDCLTQHNNEFYFPITSNGLLTPTNKSKHFLLPLILCKKYIKKETNQDVYDNVFQCFTQDLNGTGRFFEALSKENVDIPNSLVISLFNNSQGFGRVFAMGLQNTSYIHMPKPNYIFQIEDYDNIIIYINEFYDNNTCLIDFIKTLNNKKITLATIVDYSEQQYDFEIVSLLKLKVTADIIINNDSTSIISCKFPETHNNMIVPSIDNAAKQDDDIITTIMTLMSSQDYEKNSDKTKVVFLSDEDNQYLPMLISEFMSGFDTYDIYFSSINSNDLDIDDKITVETNYNNRKYIYGLQNDKFDFLFYLTQNNINEKSYLISALSQLNNIQRKNILVDNR